ncbi:MAG: Asp23/Gls24 family envelope stress response protein [Candidatus Omnitrophica bacterium]|nr:Asp23/Gls24 family envelope stress response protein [Candidatus Omnitrophota bacterium]
MRPENGVNLGIIQVHKRVIADICVAAIGEVEGVSMARNVALEDLCGLFGVRRNSSVDIRVDPHGQVSVVVKVLVRYGINLADVSRRIQDVVMTAVEKMADINLRDVHVSIQGIERA